jgi:hypothetical protein
MIFVQFNLFYEQYPYYSLSYSQFFAHYKPLMIPISFLHALFNKIKLKLCMTMVNDDTKIDGNYYILGIDCTVSYLMNC